MRLLSATLIAAGLLLTLPQRAAADNTAFATAQNMVPGQAPVTFSLSDLVAARYYVFTAVAGRSYCAEMITTTETVVVGAATLTVLRNDQSTIITNSGTAQEPLSGTSGGTGAARACWIAPATEATVVKTTDDRTSHATLAWQMRAVDTTLFSNWFFVGGDYGAYTLIRNTTSSSLLFTISWRNGAGSVVASQSGGLVPNESVFVNAGGLAGAIAATSGTLDIAHDGSPDAIVASTTVLSATTGLSFDSPFLRRQAWSGYSRPQADTTNSPIANAGPDQSVERFTVVHLNGSASTDPNSDPLTYHWSLFRPAGSTATLDNPNAVGPSFTADVAGSFTAELVVNDGTSNSAPDTVLIQVAEVGLPVVQVTATDPNASEVGPDPGVFTVTRTGGNLAASLQVFFARGGTATEVSDYASTGGAVTIPANEVSATVTITPVVDALTEGDETVLLTLSANASYTVGTPGSASVTIHDTGSAPTVSVTALDSAASEVGPNVGVFRFTRAGSTTSGLTVAYSIGGTATNGTDYNVIGSTILIPSGQSFADLTITPIADAVTEPAETVVVTVTDTVDYDLGSPVSATVVIADASSDCGGETGVLINGSTHCGTIGNAGEVDTWTFTANAGDVIGVHIGETLDNNDFRPWIRLQSPTGTLLGNQSGIDAAVIDGAVAPTTGTYQVLVASFDSLFDGTGAYRLTMAHTPGPITISAGDEGGPLTNGSTHTGAIVLGDLDVWTFTANSGDRIGINIGQVSETDDFRPWIRLWAPNGAILGSQSGTDAAVIDGVAAPVTGTYLVLVSSFDSGYNGAGLYRLTLAKTPGPITVSGGDQGGPLASGVAQTGEIVAGDLDVWTINATAGNHITVNIGEISETDDFRPWIRLWAPNGAILGSQAGVTAAQILNAVAPATGTYLVLVSTFDSGYDGKGTYQISATVGP